MRQTFVYDFHLNFTVKLLLLYTIETYCLYFEIHKIFVMVIAIFNVVLIFEQISFVCAFVLVTENRSLKKKRKRGRVLSSSSCRSRQIFGGLDHLFFSPQFIGINHVYMIFNWKAIILMMFGKKIQNTLLLYNLIASNQHPKSSFLNTPCLG